MTIGVVVVIGASVVVIVGATGVVVGAVVVLRESALFPFPARTHGGVVVVTGGAVVVGTAVVVTPVGAVVMVTAAMTINHNAATDVDRSQCGDRRRWAFNGR